MNKKLIFVIVCVAGFLALASAIVFEAWRIKSLKVERERYRNNTEVLLGEVETYRTKDSLNAVKVGVLELKLDEYKRFRDEDARLIKSLQVRNRDLEAVTAIQSQAMIELSAKLKDTLITAGNGQSEPILARAVELHDHWYDFRGLVSGDSFRGSIEVRDSLMIVETVKYKRCLFFKTKKVKNRQVDVVSRNPYVKILGCEHVVIEK